MSVRGEQGPARLEPLLKALARSPDLEPFRRLVAPLKEHDRQKGMGLVPTLRAFSSPPAPT